MFSRNLLIFVGIALFIALTFIVLTMSSRQTIPAGGARSVILPVVSPVQKTVSATIAFTQNIWRTYFSAVVAVQENKKLKVSLDKAIETQHQIQEIVLENQRLKKFLEFTHQVPETYVAARIIARDPSPWFKTLLIDKGKNDGLVKGSPVVVSEGIVGQVIQVAANYGQVLLITDRNSAVDAVIQNSRVRGIVKGNGDIPCSFAYALRKDRVNEGEKLISSGLDRVFPKGLRIGVIRNVTKMHAHLFQEISIETSVDFDKIEEVLVFKKAQ